MPADTYLDEDMGAQNSVYEHVYQRNRTPVHI